MLMLMLYVVHYSDHRHLILIIILSNNVNEMTSDVCRFSGPIFMCACIETHTNEQNYLIIINAIAFS